MIKIHSGLLKRNLNTEITLVEQHDNNIKVPQIVLADAEHIRQVLENLIRAAIRKSMKGHSIKVQYWAT